MNSMYIVAYIILFAAFIFLGYRTFKNFSHFRKTYGPEKDEKHDMMCGNCGDSSFCRNTDLPAEEERDSKCEGCDKPNDENV